MPIAPSFRPVHAPHPALHRLVRQALLAGLALVLAWPAARGHSAMAGPAAAVAAGHAAERGVGAARFPMPLRLLRRVRARVWPRVQVRRRAPAWRTTRAA